MRSTAAVAGPKVTKWLCGEAQHSPASLSAGFTTHPIISESGAERRTAHYLAYRVVPITSSIHLEMYAFYDVLPDFVWVPLPYPIPNLSTKTPHIPSNRQTKLCVVLRLAPDSRRVECGSLPRSDLRGYALPPARAGVLRTRKVSAAPMVCEPDGTHLNHLDQFSRKLFIRLVYPNSLGSSSY